MALNKSQRIVLFLVGCIGARVGLAYLALIGPLKVLSVLTGVVGVGFALIWLMGWRKNGLETGGEPIWWNHLRPIHAAAYNVSSVLLWRGLRQWAACVLLVDVVIGLVSFFSKHKLMGL